jgi:hypothetical protein
VIVEPSAGAGAFFDQLPVATRIGLDISPQHSEVQKVDFLTWTPGFSDTRVLTIGNPPYGQRAALATRFVTQACSFSEIVAFILPRIFRKYTFQNRVPQHFHLLDSFDCEEFVTASGETVTVKSVFQIWEKQSVARKVHTSSSSHPDFEMRHAHLSRTSSAERELLQQKYEFTIPQVGSVFSPRELREVTRGSHWFIKPLVPGVREKFEHLDFTFLDGMNTAHKSLAKADIIAAYEAVGDGT